MQGNIPFFFFKASLAAGETTVNIPSGEHHDLSSTKTRVGCFLARDNCALAHTADESGVHGFGGHER